MLPFAHFGSSCIQVLFYKSHNDVLLHTHARKYTSHDHINCYKTIKLYSHITGYHLHQSLLLHFWNEVICWFEIKIFHIYSGSYKFLYVIRCDSYLEFMTESWNTSNIREGTSKSLLYRQCVLTILHVGSHKTVRLNLYNADRDPIKYIVIF